MEEKGEFVCRGGEEWCTMCLAENEVLMGHSGGDGAANYVNLSCR